MTQDEIIEMAVQAKLYSGNPRTPSTGRMIEKRLEAFAKLVEAKATAKEREKLKNVALFDRWYQELDAAVLAEREAIKALAEKELLNTAALMSMPPQSSAAWNILQAIQARGES